MVLSTYDDSPLALLRLARSEAEAELRRSLAKASMLALSLCVSVLLARALFFHPGEFKVYDPPPYLPPTIIDVMTPVAPTGTPPPPTVATDARGAVLPVDQETHSDSDKMVPPAAPITDGPVTDGPVGNNANIPGPGTVAPPREPDPGEFVFTDVMPEAVTRVKPDYPAIARDAGMEGKVVVRMLVGLDGRVRRAELERSSPVFDEAALAAARQWTFTPATTNGKPVMVWVRVPFDFRLH
jgi:protein TonB